MPVQTTHLRFKTAILTILALTAFSANSVLCRLALGRAAIDASSFATVRLLSGALTLWLILFLMKSTELKGRGNWISGAMLFLYAIAFSFAYVSLSAGTGALILFGAVQATMILSGLWSGERPHSFQWAGLAVALSGLVYLVFPGLTAPSLSGSFLMAIAGMAWGVYSLRGRGAGNPIAVTRDNFARSVPFVLAVSAVCLILRRTWLEPKGVALAVASGAVASGIGYVIWYAALRDLTVTRAATVQLCVPVLAAIGGVLFLSETVSTRLLISAVSILGGVALAVFFRERLVRAVQVKT